MKQQQMAKKAKRNTAKIRKDEGSGSASGEKVKFEKDDGPKSSKKKKVHEKSEENRR